MTVTLQQTEWGTHYKVKAYPFDMRDQFSFITDVTVRGKLALADCGAEETAALPGALPKRH